MKNLHRILLLIGCALLSERSFSDFGNDVSFCQTSATVSDDVGMLNASVQTINNATKLRGEVDDLYVNKIFFTGIVRDKNCVPIANAVVKLAQVDEYGIKRYEKFSYSFSKRYDLNFAHYSKFVGFAQASTDNRGFFSFVTSVPKGGVENLGNLLQLQVSHPDFQEITVKIDIPEIKDTIIYKTQIVLDGTSRFKGY